MRKLVIIEGADEREVELREGKYYLGRLSSNQIQLTEGGVSRRHAKIEVTGDRVVLTDLGSLNGTYVNDVEIRIHDLADDDIIEIGSYLIKYVEDQDSAEEGFEPVVGMADLEDSSEALPLPGDRPRRGILQLRRLLPTDRIDVRKRMIGWIIVTTLFTSFFVGLPLLRFGRAALRESATEQGKLLVQIHAVANRDALASGRLSLIDVDSVRANKGVVQAYVLDEAGAVVAPAGTPVDETMVRAARAPKQLDQPLGEALVRLSYPIRAEGRRVGTALLDFSLAQANRRAGEAVTMILLLGLVACGFASFIAYRLGKTIYHPVAKLTKEVELAIKQDFQHELPRLGLVELDRLAEAIERVFERSLKKEAAAQDALREAQVAAGVGAGIPRDAVARLAERMRVGVVIAGPDNAVSLINGVACRILGVRPDEVLSRHILDGFRSAGMRSALLRCLRAVKGAAAPVAEHREVVEGLTAIEVHALRLDGDERPMYVVLIEGVDQATTTRAMPRLGVRRRSRS